MQYLTRVICIEMKRWLTILVYFTCLVGSQLAQFAPETVDTNYGKVKGLITEKAKVFRGIPYAQPPVKELRWRDPLPPFPWPGILQVTEDPPACPQHQNCTSPKWVCPTRIQEDCLYLNVFTPLTAMNASKLPVMVFMHGGGFTEGYCGGILHDGQYMVNYTDIILVTINYRLGALGFLVYGSNLEIGGNYGLKDQRLALKWVQENIAYFGGDPSSVTIFGQSAGAISVASHMCSVKSSGLFHKAIIESDPMGISLKEKVDSVNLGHRFAKKLGCGDDDVPCVREKDVDSIIAAEQRVDNDVVDIYHLFDTFLQWTPYVDGIEISDQPVKAFKAGRVASIPLIMGNVKEEAYSDVSFTDPYVYAAVQATFYGVENYPRVAEKYPFIKGVDNNNEMTMMMTDNPFWCPTRYAAAGFTNSTGFPVWLYNFDHVASFDFWPPDKTSCASHVCHSEELSFLFHTAPLSGYKYTAEEEGLSDHMITYWTNLAKYGDPNGAGDLTWPQYTYQTKSVLRFMTPANKVDDYRSDYCDFWDQLGYNV